MDLRSSDEDRCVSRSPRYPASMRKLLFTRGAPGAGKSTAIRALGLENFLLSADVLRTVFAGPTISELGTMGVPQDHDARVWPFFFARLRERMERGETLVLDATHTQLRHITPYLPLASRHQYEVACIDASDVPLETCLSQNLARDPVEQVPPQVVERMWNECRAVELPGEITRIPHEDHDAIRAFLDVPVADLSTYAEVLTIGDLQGCAWPLLNPSGLIPGGVLRDDTFYVFVGDLCDRGPENAEVLEFALSVHQRENVVFLWGNHEDHLVRFANGEEPVSTEFEERTLPQLHAAAITPEMIRPLCSSFREVFPYSRGEQKVLVSHAGMPIVPAQMWKISGHQWARGAGRYSAPVDEHFSAQADAGWVQIHGHRNVKLLPSEASPRSYNLEGKVEFGGHLRAVRHRDGFETVDIVNTRYRPIRVFAAAGKLRREKSYPDWVDGELDVSPSAQEELVPKLLSSESVYERQSSSRPNISAFNFTRDVFFQSAWDEISTQARGLFIDMETKRIAARSYDKFFNLGERPETALSVLAETIEYPAEVYLKENGYLGIVGYDEKRRDLLVASKSSIESDFAGWLRERIEERLSEGQREALIRYLRDAHASLVFEVIEPERDPHIIEYEAPRLILLDIIRREYTFERASFKRLQNFGERFGFEVKEKAATLKNADALRGFIEATKREDYQYRGRFIEGFVIEDQTGPKVKLKLHYYAYWKRLRSLQERVRNIRGTKKSLGRDISEPSIAAFHAWLVEQDDETLRLPITEVRKRYLAGHSSPIGEQRARQAEDRKRDGFRQALDGLQRSIEAGETIRSATANQLLERALETDALMALLREHSLRNAIVMAAEDGENRRHAAQALGVDID